MLPPALFSSPTITSNYCILCIQSSPPQKKFVKEKKMEFSMFDFETFLQFEIKGGLKLLIGSNENSLLA